MRVKNSESKSQVVAELNVERSNIKLWIKKYEEMGYNGFMFKQRKENPYTMKKREKKLKKN